MFAVNSLLYLNQSVPPYGVSLNSQTNGTTAFPLRKPYHLETHTCACISDIWAKHTLWWSSSLVNVFWFSRCSGWSEDHTGLFPVWLYCLWQDGHLFERRRNVSHCAYHKYVHEQWWQIMVPNWVLLCCSYVLTLITDGMRSVRAFHFDKAAASVLTTCVSSACHCEQHRSDEKGRLNAKQTLKYSRGQMQWSSKWHQKAVETLSVLILWLFLYKSAVGLKSSLSWNLPEKLPTLLLHD